MSSTYTIIIANNDANKNVHNGCEIIVKGRIHVLSMVQQVLFVLPYLRVIS